MSGLLPRNYRIEEYTRSVCPSCMETGTVRSGDPGAFVDAMLVSHDGKVWLRRFCALHGETESLYEEDVELWLSRFGWSTPTLAVTPDRKDNFGGFPNGYGNGLPASHGQHTCILLLNVTDRCNFACPTCYASAEAPGTPAQQPESPTLSEILHTVDTVLEREQHKLGVVMLSGGEPTLRKDLEEIIARLAERPITRVMINTNGRRIARDDRFQRTLHDFRDRVEVYLQFDGFRPDTHLRLRGEDLSEEKPLALRRLQEAGVYTTLVATVAKGVNEDEVGDILQFGFEHPKCAGLAIQPVFGSGRNPGFDPMDRATPTGVMRRLEEQTNGRISADDFIPLPCSHRDCCDITYLLQSKTGEWKSLLKLLGRDRLKEWIHLVANTIAFDTASDTVKELVTSGALQRVLSEQQKTSAIALAMDVLRMCDCVPGVTDLLGPRRSLLERMADRTFRVTVKMFMDAHTFHEHRIRQCCVHTGTFEEDPRRYSFCWRWLFADAGDFPERESRLRVIS